MQRKQNVSRNYKALFTEKKVVFYLKIQGKMAATGSGFPNTNLVYSYILGLAAINGITTALNAAANGGKGTAEAVIKAVNTAEAFIDYWADIVDLVSGGDPVVIVGSGFTATKAETTPTVINPQPRLDYLPQKQAGTVTVFIENRTIFVERPWFTFLFGSNLDTLTRSGDLMYCTDDTIHLYVINGKKEILVTGLPTGEDMQCVCVITNSAGVSIYSNIVKFKVP